MKKDIKPVINTINTKSVEVKGKNDFSSSLKSSPNKTIAPIIINEQTKNIPKVIKQPPEDTRKKATKTQKMSADVILKIDILKPFLKELDEVDGHIKPTINDMVDLLLDNYIHTKLTTKQLEAYTSMYKIRYEQI